MRRILLVPALAAALAAAATAQDMIGVSWAGDVYAIDSTTGTGSLLSNAGSVIRFNSLARRSDGKLFTADAVGSNHDIYEVDPVSGAVTLVTTVPLTAIRAMAFGPSDELYAINDNGSSAPSDILYTIDLGAGTVKQIGDTGLDNLQALAWGNSTLYGWEVLDSSTGTGAGLVTIDPQTAASKDVDPATQPADAGIQSLTFDSQGTLYGGRDELYKVDISSGALTLVGSGGYADVRGLEFIKPTGGGPTIYCTAKTTSIAGCVPTIGGPSATASLTAGSGSYDVTCGPVPGGQNVGVLTYTTNGALSSPMQTAFGFQCIQTGPGHFMIQPVQFPGGTTGTCSGAYRFDFGGYLAAPNSDPALVAGAQVDMQVLYRDPQNTGTANLSNAMAFTLVP